MNQLAIFTKPWKALSLPELAEHIKSLGFDQIELPVRPGFQVEPDNIERDSAGRGQTAWRTRRPRHECDDGCAAG